ncbi:hypothetical protein CBP16_06860, partial [Fischerella thermalis WC217]
MQPLTAGAIALVPYLSGKLFDWGIVLTCCHLVYLVTIVLLNSQIPEELEWFKSVLLDPQGECLYLIRPDGYIGHRTQPADVFKLWTYLQK